MLLLLVELPLQLAVVVNELAQQSSCLQGMVWPGALTQSETATDGQPVTSPYALRQSLNKVAAVDGLKILTEVPRCKLLA
jgi:hypothetical protein